MVACLFDSNKLTKKSNKVFRFLGQKAKVAAILVVSIVVVENKRKENNEMKMQRCKDEEMKKLSFRR